MALLDKAIDSAPQVCRAFKVRESTPLEGTLLDKTTDSAQQNTGGCARQTTPVEVPSTGVVCLAHPPVHKATDSAQQSRAEPNSKHCMVYDILPSTTAVFNYAIGSRKLLANEQFFVGAQTVVSLLQTTQIISDVCFIIDYVTYASSNKTKIV